MYLGSLVGPKSENRRSTAPQTREAFALITQEAEGESYGLHHWGIRLVLLARSSKSEAARYFAAAYKKYAVVIDADPNDFLCLYSWGSALLIEGLRKSGEQARQLFEAAIPKFAQAQRLKPDFARALSAWATALLFLGQIEEAIEKSMQAEELEPGSGSLNLAYVSAAQGSKEKTMAWLARASPQPSQETIAELRVFDAFRNHPDFRAYCESLPETAND